METRRSSRLKSKLPNNDKSPDSSCSPYFKGSQSQQELGLESLGSLKNKEVPNKKLSSLPRQTVVKSETSSDDSDSSGESHYFTKSDPLDESSSDDSDSCNTTKTKIRRSQVGNKTDVKVSLPAGEVENKSRFFRSENPEHFQCNLSSESESEDEKPVCKTQVSEPTTFESALQNTSDISAENESGFYDGDNVAEYYDFGSILSQNQDLSPPVKEKKLETPSKEIPKKSKTLKKPKRSIEDLKVTELLVLGEKAKISAKDIPTCSKNENSVPGYEIPKNIEVTVSVPGSLRNKKPTDLDQALKRRLNLIKQEYQRYIHKVSACVWIAHGNYINSVLNDVELLSSALSLLPSDKCYPKNRMDMNYLEELIKWYRKKVLIPKGEFPEILDAPISPSSLKEQIKVQSAKNKRDFVFIFICVLRSLGLKARVTINLNALPVKLSKSDLLPITNKPEVKSDNHQELLPVAENTVVRINKEELKEPATKKPKVETSESVQISAQRSTSRVSKEVQSNKTKKEKSELGVKQTRSNNRSSDSKNDLRNKSKASQKSHTSTTRPIRKSRNVNYDEASDASDDEFVTNTKKSQYFENHAEDTKRTTKAIDESKKKAGLRPNLKKDSRRSAIKKVRKDSESSDDSVSDFIVPVKKEIDRRVLSTDEDEAETGVQISNTKKQKQKGKNNYWTEVYLEAEESWACVDIIKGGFHCQEQLYANASQPIRYIVSWNNDNTVKDVTRRYDPQWLTHTRKLRVSDSWWEETLSPYKPHNTPQNREEDEELDKKDVDQPLPTSISDYKNHPLYALERHLLKFQAIYPKDTKPVGFVKGEAVYPRSCVHHLHGREMWIKEAKVVKMGEIPYKIVKGRPKRDRYGYDAAAERKDIELFGSWQIEDYVPPVAKDGIVPRNAFGNVELFKECMLPKGTAYLQVPGLLKVANKLKIDCAPAVTGFEFSNGYSYPVKDGFVVCEEFVGVLLDAWNAEIEEFEKRESQKRRERAVKNWKKLVKLIRIQKRLKRKYNFQNLGSAEVQNEVKTKRKMAKKVSTV